MLSCCQTNKHTHKQNNVVVVVVVVVGVVVVVVQQYSSSSRVEYLTRHSIGNFGR